jgi:hypothetical protein
MKYRQTLFLLSSALLIAQTVLAADEPKPDNAGTPTKAAIDGTWKWIFAMPDGTKVEPKLKLKMEEGKLTGTSTFRPGNETPISEGQFKNGAVSFQVVRQRDGQTVIAKYRGQLHGDTIKGTIESDWTGETQTYVWEAKRPPPTATGIWMWKVRYGTAEFEMKLKLTQDGEKLTGKIAAVGRREHDIAEGNVKHGEVFILDERERDGRKYSTRYHAKLDGDTLKGKVEIDWDGDKRLRNWQATRVSDLD